MRVKFFTRVIAASLLLVMGSGAALAQSLVSMIDAAETAFGGEAYAVESLRNIVEVKLLSGNQLIEIRYHADSGALLDSEVYGRPRVVQRVATSLNAAVLTLPEAIGIAEGAVGRGEVLEAELQVSRRISGRRFLIDIATDDGIFDVLVDSRTGRILRVIRD
jgi:hypothetical protein